MSAPYTPRVAAAIVRLGRAGVNVGATEEYNQRRRKEDVAMTTRQLIVLALFVILTWAGSAGVALATVELAGGGEQGLPGPQGEQGPRGERGARGLAGTSGDSDLFGTSGLERLAELWAVERISLQNIGQNITGAHPQVQACVAYIVSGIGSFVECGFQRAE